MRLFAKIRLTLLFSGKNFKSYLLYRFWGNILDRYGILIAWKKMNLNEIRKNRISAR